MDMNIYTHYSAIVNLAKGVVPCLAAHIQYIKCCPSEKEHMCPCMLIGDVANCMVAIYVE